MEIKQYIVDAFTRKLFSGNQAAVCLPDMPLNEGLMQKIAVENNFSETAFAVKTSEGYDLRWFTPGGEIDLCGHATLGTAYVILSIVEPESNKVVFSTMKSGKLTVEKDCDLIRMDFPQSMFRQIEVTDDMERVIGKRPKEAYLGRDLLMIMETEDDVRNYVPDATLLKQLPGLNQSITAKGNDYDCVSRVFGPKLDVLEDPVTGSTHCMIAPYWGNVMQKDTIRAYQASKRGGELICKLPGNGRVIIEGSCVKFSESILYV